jgi:hypothetical protein
METHSVFLQVLDFREALILQVQLVVEGGCLELPILSALLSDPLLSHYQRHLFLSALSIFGSSKIAKLSHIDVCQRRRQKLLSS